MQQLGKRGVSAEIVAEGKRIAEVAEQRRQLLVVATGHRRTNDDVLDFRVAVHERVERGQQHHEQRHSLVARKLSEELHKIVPDGELAHLAAVALRAGPCPVRGQLEPSGRTRKLARPVLDQLGKVAPGKLFALPLREVRILDRKLRQLGLHPFPKSAVQLIELGEQDAAGQMVGGHMMEDDEQQVLVSIEVYERGAQQHVAP